MRSVGAFACLVVLTFVFAPVAKGENVTGPAVLPMPTSLVLGEGALPIDSHFTTNYAGCGDPRMQGALQRLAQRVANETGLPIRAAKAASVQNATLSIECSIAGKLVPSLGEDESYRLEVTPRGAKLTARSGTGALRGLETFAQLVVAGPESFYAPSLQIEDRPRFAWRGLMLDTSRHWIAVPVLERNLDAMAAVKLNVLHWHFSDDQGFRVQSKRYPKLHELGSDGSFYTRDDVRHIVSYAAERGIRVVPEIDVPGHASAILAAYPQLGASSGPYHVANGWGIFSPTLDPTNPKVYEFLDALFAEMAQLFPDSYFHVGGDEVQSSEWDSNHAIAEFKRSHGMQSATADPAGNIALHAYFNRRIVNVLRKYGKTAVGWEEILQPDISDDVVVQSWSGPQTLAEATRRHHPGLLSFGYYLDYLQPAATYYAVDPQGGVAAQVNGGQPKLVLGGEACMWSEFANSETLDSRVWPAAAAIAERFWSASSVTDRESMYQRLGSLSRKLEWVSLRHRANYGPMLDRIAGGQAEPALRVLADALEPRGVEREFLRTYTPATPLNRLVDAARPESELVRRLEGAATTLLATPGDSAAYAELELTFRQWEGNDSRLTAVLSNNFLLEGLDKFSADLSRIGNSGLRALHYVKTNEPAPEGWLTDELKNLDALDARKSELTLAASRPLRILISRLKERAGPNIE
jgi:hexosaminidase